MKNPFKTSSIVDTLVNVGLGGAANVAMDYAFENIDALASIAEHKNIIKIAAGAVGGAMVSGKSAKWVRPALDGIATVGISDLIAGYMGTEETGGGNNGGSGDDAATAGAPFIGKVGLRMGQRGFRKVGVRGTGSINGQPFMGK